MGATVGRASIYGTLVLACLPLGGCAAVLGVAVAPAVVGLAVDATYSAAFRARIEDASDLSPDELKQLEKVQLFTTDRDLVYTSIRQVTGLSCRAGWLRWVPAMSEVNGKTPEEAAMTQLKISAIKSGANAILSPTCVYDSHADWQNNCWQTWKCAGAAIRVE